MSHAAAIVKGLLALVLAVGLAFAFAVGVGFAAHLVWNLLLLGWEQIP